MEPRYEGAFLIARIHQTAGRIFEGILRQNDLDTITPAQGRILFVLWKTDNIPIQELAQQTSLSKSTLTVMLDRLEAAGLVARVPSKEDRREILIRLTDKDRSLRDVYARVSQEMADIILSGLDRQEIVDLEDKLRRVLANLVTFEEKTRKSADPAYQTRIGGTNG
jgi:DNA-binding MarR family transcriptional regulator